MKKTRILTECALMIALSTILSFLVIWEAPLGGSVTVLSMIPIM
ncbi:MAG: energy-coupled thiamine transporter ThiT, partial [Clostridia bacterium]